MKTSTSKKNLLESAIHGIFLILGLITVACVLLNLISGFTVSQKENAKPYMYYIMAVVAFVATGIMIYLGMK